MSLARNASWLMVAHLAGLAIPLLELPILTRALGQQVFGQYVYTISIAIIASVLVEFGFNLTAARDVVHARGDRLALARIVSEVSVSRALLYLIVSVPIALVVILDIGSTRVPDAWLGFILVSVLAMGFSPIWYYTGIQRLAFVAAFDLILRGIGLAALALFVRSPEDVSIALGLQAAVGFLNTLLPTLVMLRATGVARVGLGDAIARIRESWNMFLFKGAQNIAASASTLMLGAFSGQLGAGAFAPAEKLARAAAALAMPVLTAAYPVLVGRQTTGAGPAPGSNRRDRSHVFLAIFVGTAVAGAAGVCAFSDELVRFVFGADYGTSARILSILVWVVPLRIAFSAMAMLWLFPRGMDAVVSRATILNVGLLIATGLPAAWGAGPVALAVVMVLIEAIALWTLYRGAPKEQ